MVRNAMAAESSLIEMWDSRGGAMHSRCKWVKPRSAFDSSRLPTISRDAGVCASEQAIVQRRIPALLTLRVEMRSRCIAWLWPLLHGSGLAQKPGCAQIRGAAEDATTVETL